MSSTLDDKLLNVLGQAQQDLVKASKPTPCVMISEENWKAIIETLQSELEALNKLREIQGKFLTSEQMVNLISQIENIHLDHEQSWVKELEEKSNRMTTELSSQVGKLSEQSASDLAKAKQELKKELEDHSDKMHRCLIIPCLLMTLLSGLVLLWQIWQM